MPYQKQIFTTSLTYNPMFIIPYMITKLDLVFFKLLSKLFYILS
jgi:hypothetical protein